MRRLPLLLVLSLAWATPAAAAAGHWVAIADKIGTVVTRAEAAFARGDLAAAKRELTEAYFAEYEDSKMEAAVRKAIGARRAAEVEAMFATLRKAMVAGDQAKAAEVAASLKAAMAADAAQLDTAKVPASVYEVNQ